MNKGVTSGKNIMYLRRQKAFLFFTGKERANMAAPHGTQIGSKKVFKKRKHSIDRSTP